MYKSVLAEELAFFMKQLPLRIIKLVNWSVFVMCLKQEWIMQIEYL